MVFRCVSFFCGSEAEGFGPGIQFSKLFSLLCLRFSDVFVLKGFRRKERFMFLMFLVFRCVRFS